MKNVFIKTLLIAAGFVLSQSAQGNPKLDEKFTEETKKMVSDFYERSMNTKDAKNATKDPETVKGEFIESLGDIDEKEKNAYNTLLPKFFQIVATEARKPGWFWGRWKSNYKKSDWWKALSKSKNDFMVYIYMINDEKKKRESKITTNNEKGYIKYKLNNITLKKESTSFFRRHWGKIALAAVVAAGTALTAKHRDDIYPLAEKASNYIGRRSIFGPNEREKKDQEDLYKRVMGQESIDKKISRYEDFLKHKEKSLAKENKNIKSLEEELAQRGSPENLVAEQELREYGGNVPPQSYDTQKRILNKRKESFDRGKKDISFVKEQIDNLRMQNEIDKYMSKK